MKISCANVMLPGSSLTEKAHLLREWGYDGIALFINYPDWSDELHEEILQIEQKTGIVPCEFAFSSPIYGHLMSDDLTLRRQCRDMYRLAAQVAGELGAVTEMEFAYGAQNPLPLFHPYQEMSASEQQGFIEMYEEITQPLTGTKGLMLLEGINRYESPYLNSIKQCKDVVDKLTFSNAGVLADFFHMSIEEANIADSLRYVGSEVKHVHLGDNNRLLPGHGTLDWQSGFNTLQEIGFKGYVSLECSTCGDPAQTLPVTGKFLRSLIDEAANAR